MDFFTKDNKKALEAQYEAQKIAFGPVIFQAVRCLKELGILELVADSGIEGITQEELVSKVKLSEYGIRVLLEAGLGIGVVKINDQKYSLTKTGHFILYDEMTRVNFDFTQDICYQGMFELKASLLEERPAGLKFLGPWNTIYEGLSKLPEPLKTSWFEFDHYYSDQAFPEVIPLIFKYKPKRLFDVGGNTGKFSLQCVKYDPEVNITIVDLPGQWGMAEQNIKEEGFLDRISGYPINLLDQTQALPRGADAVWMSQFLDCFSEKEIVSILKRAADALTTDGAVYILETYWDRQKYEAAAFSLQMTSLYFTAMANGNSQMYHSKDMIRCIHEAGLYVDEDIDGIGVSHTLFRCKRK